MVELAGEPHAAVPPIAEVVASFAHITDLHVTDAQSPARFEYMNREAKDPRFRELLPMHRPQETLNAHAIAAMVRAVNEVEAGPVTGSPLQLVAVTGDLIDNAQHNELTNALALLGGGEVRPDSGAPGYDGVQSVDWEGDVFWKPDGKPDGDVFQRDFGFPQRPGLLDEAVRPFHAQGLRLPWLACGGNHEYVCQGVGLVNPILARAMAGDRKPVDMPPGIDRENIVETFVQHPELFMSGPTVEVPADAGRGPIKRHELLPPPNHVQDTERVRFITLDTVCYAGGADGCIDPDQLRRLERQLAESGDRYVVLLSHHGYERISNPRGPQNAAALMALLHSHPNVVLWLNGHTHKHEVAPRGSFWEVTTASVVDWPCQGRLIEIFRTADGKLGIATTVLDHDGEGLAGLHRELAANVPRAGFGSRKEGAPPDRNAILLVPPPE